MKKLAKTLGIGGLAAATAFLIAGPAQAEVSSETAYVFNTFSFLVCGALVMWMAAGFAMLESGLVRTKNTATICLKNIVLYAVAGIMYYLFGYFLMYTGVDGGFIGTFDFLYNPSEAEISLLDAATDENLAEVIGNSYSVSSDWFFQMVFVATAASIVSGTVAERIKFWPFMIFVVVLTGIIYPIQGSWTWGAGWLIPGVPEGFDDWEAVIAAGNVDLPLIIELGGKPFSDFAGSTIVHSVGGWAALVGAIILGPRIGKYAADGRVNPIPGSNLPLATLGTFVLWLGWFGFNGGSQLALGSAADATNMSIVFVNTNLGAAAGVVTAALMSQIMFKKIDLTMALNGAIAGLVSITAGPDLQNHLLTLIVGGIGGILVVVAVPLIDKLKIDDVVGAISAHLVAGIWGTLAVGIFGSGSLVTQIVGIIAVGVFVSAASAIVWLALKYTIGIRADQEDEVMGLDKAELGMEAYPEFGEGSQRL